MHYEVEIEGAAPGLVMNNPASMGTAEAGKVPKPAQEAETKCYRMEKSRAFRRGELFVPGEALKACLLSVASSYKMKINAKSTTPKSWLAGGAFIAPDRVGLGVEDYEVYVTPAVVQRSRVQRARARVFPWRLAFRLEFSTVDPIFQDIAVGLKSVIPQMWRMAGIMKGILDNRPGAPKKPGPHGTFKVLRCELVGEE